MGAALGTLFVCIAGAHSSKGIFYAPDEDEFTFHRLGCKLQSHIRQRWAFGRNGAAYERFRIAESQRLYLARRKFGSVLIWCLVAFKWPYVHRQRLRFVTDKYARLQPHSNALATRERKTEPNVLSRS